MMYKNIYLKYVILENKLSKHQMKKFTIITTIYNLR
jgi:hypothetical protein